MINVIVGWLAGLTSVVLFVGGWLLVDNSYVEDNPIGFIIGGLVMMVFGATMFFTMVWAGTTHWTF